MEHTKIVRGIFLHIPKTAGTSLVTEMRWHYGNNACASHHDHAVALDDYSMRHKFFQSPEKVSHYAALPFISGHFGFKFCERFMDKRYAFTFLRNPAERLISFYYFCKNRNDPSFLLYRTAQQTSFNDFLDMALEKGHWLRFWLWNNQTWSLAWGNFAPEYKNVDDFSADELLRLAKEHAERLDYIGFVESLEEDKRHILRALGIGAARVHEPCNIMLQRPRLEDLPTPTRKRLARLTELDNELYQYLCALRQTPVLHDAQPQIPFPAVQAEKTLGKAYTLIEKYLPVHTTETVDRLQQEVESWREQATAGQQHLDSLLYLLQKKRCTYLDLITKVLCGTICNNPGQMEETTSTVADTPRAHRQSCPLHAHSMMSFKQLHDVRLLMESVLGNNIPGDVIETGVWRGGASIMMRAVLGAYDVTDRNVYVTDLFEKPPHPEERECPADADSRSHEYAEIAVPLETVREHFAACGLLDKQVVFVKGCFRNTLSSLAIDKLSLVCLNSSTYGSAMDSLIHLYDKLSDNGYVIVNSYHISLPCKQAVHDFCMARHITPRMEEIDGAGVYWQKRQDA